MSFKQLLENMEHHFEPGGKYAKYYALFEAAYTLFYTPGYRDPQCRPRP